MNIDHTNLLKALKRDELQPDISDAEKIEVADELHDWLIGKEHGEVRS